ncbi:MAG: hypothetical protein RL077_3571 [Verrucomicrobiota bacterium]
MPHHTCGVKNRSRKNEILYLRPSESVGLSRLQAFVAHYSTFYERKRPKNYIALRIEARGLKFLSPADG